jgi:hypothetical protein
MGWIFNLSIKEKCLICGGFVVKLVSAYLVLSFDWESVGSSGHAGSGRGLSIYSLFVAFIALEI